MKSVSSYFVDWWRLVVPYFRSEERWIAIALLVGAIVLTLASVTVNVAFSEWNRRFYDSLQNKDEAAFWIEMAGKFRLPVMAQRQWSKFGDNGPR